MGEWLNPGWDGAFATGRVEQLGLDLRQRAGTLSGGQRAQLALTLAVAKRPELLLLDEPVASLDPLARREFLETLMEVLARGGVTVVLSFHLLADLERVCDHLVVLVTGRVGIAGDVDTLLASHRRLTGPRQVASTLPATVSVIESSHTDKQTTLLVRSDPRRRRPRLYASGPRRCRGPPAIGGGTMTRFAWLQSRTQTLTVAAAVAAVSAVAVITGVHLSHLYNSTVRDCQASCGVAISELVSHEDFLQRAFDLLARLAPALLGLFWGAPPLARELETGTYRLAWTQSVTRSRWLVTKFAVVGLATVAVGGLLTLTITWWYRAVDLVSTNQYAVFDRRAIAPVGYAAFAFASGALIGAIIRRTLPAMATTLALFTFARVAVGAWIRPHLLSPLHQTTSMLDADRFGFVLSDGGSRAQLVARASGPPNSWTLSSHLVTNSGKVPSGAQLASLLHQSCPDLLVTPASAPAGHTISGGPDPGAIAACRAQAAHMLHVVVAYQPANRYWTFQWLEAGVFVALALLAGAACYWWITRRIA